MNRVRTIIIVLVNILIFWVLIPFLLYLSGSRMDALVGISIDAFRGRLVGIPIAVAGTYICLHAMVLLKTIGRGLPISALGPARLVTTGPYRLYRHPIYTGFLYLVSGMGIILGSLGTITAVALFALIWFNTWVRLYEEPGLYRRFGADYRIFRRRRTIILPFRIRTLFRKMILVLFRMFFRVTVEGRENIPGRGPFVYVTDHQCYYDFILGHYLHPDLTVIPVSAEAFRRPLQRLFMGIIMGAVPKRRFCGDPAANLAVMDEVRAGGIAGIAVMGERSWTGELHSPAPGVALNLLRLGCPLVPASFSGSYGLWPRWAGSADKSAPVIVRIGRPFLLCDVLERAGCSVDDAKEAAEIIRAKIEEVRSPNEPSLDITRYRRARPELALWRCPLCRREGRLAFTDNRWLACGGCGARWDARGGDLTLVEPRKRAGVKKTIAGWSREAGSDITGIGTKKEPVLTAAAELREDPDASVTLLPLRSWGGGTAHLYRDRLEWIQGPEKKEYLLSAVRSVTTERNDTLQLGIGRGVVQLVFESASPLQWQLYTERILSAMRGRGGERDE